MNEVVFLTSFAQSQIEKKIVSGIRNWIKHWCFEELIVEIAYLHKNRLVDGSKVFSCSNHKCFISISDSNIEWDCTLFGRVINDIPNDKIKEKLIINAISDIVNTIYHSLSGHYSGILSEINDDNIFSVKELTGKNHVGDHFATFRCFLNKQYIDVGVNINWLQGLRAVSSRSKSKLRKLNVENLSNEVDLSISLDLGSYNLSDVNNLAVGDVLTSTTAITTLFNVCLDKNTLTKAYLGKSDANKAVLLTKNREK
jgi:hypothetical protein